MTRILYIIPTLDRSGAEKQLTMLATRLPREEFQIEVCALTRGGPFELELQAAGVPVHVLGKRLKIDPVAAWRLFQLIRRGRFDVVHTWLFAANWHGRAMAQICRVPIIVVSERCADHWKGFSELLLDRWLAPGTDSIVVNSRGVLDFYKAKGLDPSKLVLIENGITDSQLGVRVNRETIIAELGLPSDAEVLGIVGRLWPQKRVRDAIWAVEVLRNVRPRLHLVIVGDGPDREDLKEYARKAVLDQRVWFLGSRSDVDRILNGIDVLLLPSQFEGMSNTLMEAMVAGRPVIASDIPGNDELVRDGKTGFLVPVGDIKALASRINQLLDDRSLREELGQAGRRRVLEEFSVDRMVEQHVSLYRKLKANESV